jgi:hypothetical protein
VKTALVTALAIPLTLLAPLAQAQGPIPTIHPTPDQMCTSTQQIVDTVRAKQPDAALEQIATTCDQMMGAKLPIIYQAFQGLQHHQQLLELIHACGIK